MSEATRVQLRKLRDKFLDHYARMNAPGMVHLLSKWMVACDRSARDHLIGNNSHLGIGRILEMMLTAEEDKALLWEICELAPYAWRKDLQRLIGTNNDLGLQPAAYTASLSAGAPRPHCPSIHPAFLIS